MNHPDGALSDDQHEVIDFLSRPDSYGLCGGAVERCQTHGAIVFLAGDRAYKLKRAVRYPYMDYSTRERRRAMCERELVANRRTAPDLYLGVQAIIRDPSGHLRLAATFDPDDAIDCVVVMRRFAQSQLLSELHAQGALSREITIALAEAIAAFHDKAERTPPFGGSAGIQAVVEENAAIFAAAKERIFDAGLAGALTRQARSTVEAQRALLDVRQSQSFVRRCHGDLHLGNVCLIDGRPVLFDAIEFSDAFACIDVLYDLAFPLMELAHDNDLAAPLLNRYLELTDDYAGLPALPLFLSCRAAIRAHVTIARAAAGADTMEAACKKAVKLVELAVAFLERPQPRLVALGGVSGTGKSSLAYALAPALGAAPGAVVLRSDITRKRLFGAKETDRLPQAAYTVEATARVFATLRAHAAAILGAGFSVVVDAVHGEPEEQEAIARIARRGDFRFDGLWLTAGPETLAQRIEFRVGDASDATVDVLKAQLQRTKPAANWQAIEAGGSRDETLRSARSALGIDHDG